MKRIRIISKAQPLFRHIGRAEPLIDKELVRQALGAEESDMSESNTKKIEFGPEEFFRDDEKRPGKNFAVLPEGNSARFSFRTPFDFKLAAIKFGDDFDIDGIYVGQQSALIMTPGCAVPSSDFDDGIISCAHLIRTGWTLTMSLMTRNCSRTFDVRLIGTKVDALAETSSVKTVSNTSGDVGPFLRKSIPSIPTVTSPAVVHVDSGYIAPGETADVRLYPHFIFQSQRLIADVDGMTLIGAEVGRDPQPSLPMSMRRRNRFAMKAALPMQEIRLFVRNDTDKKQSFTGRLHGQSVRNS